MTATVAFSKGMKPLCEDPSGSELEMKYPNLTLPLSHLFMVPPPLSKHRKSKGKGAMHFSFLGSTER